MTREEYNKENLVGMDGECYLVNRLPSDFYEEGRMYGDGACAVYEGRVRLVEHLPAVAIFTDSRFQMGEIVEVRIYKKDHPLNTKIEFLKARLIAAKEMINMCQEDLLSKTSWENCIKDLEEQIAKYKENS